MLAQLSTRTLVFYILAAASVVLLILSSTGVLSPLEGTLLTTARPLLVSFSALGQQISNVVETARDLTTLRVRNDQLQKQVDSMIIENLRLKEVEGENERLRRLLQFRQLNPTYDVRGGQVIANVLSLGSSNYLRTITIDLGSSQGIQVDMPVVTEAGLVGRIYKVGPMSSLVLLITEPSSSIPGLIQRNRVVGVVNGQGSAPPLMEYIPQYADMVPGDLVITSGLGGNLPKNLVIGQVVQVNRRDFDMFQQAVVKPTVDFDRLEVVLVITNFRPLPGDPQQIDSVG